MQHGSCSQNRAMTKLRSRRSSNSPVIPAAPFTTIFVEKMNFSSASPIPTTVTMIAGLQTCDRTLPAADLLLAFNHFVLNNLEHSPYMDLFASLYGLQVATTGTRHILNPDRNYYKILRKILFDGIKCGELKSDYSYVELSQMITSAQIGLTYSWCLTQRSFSLLQYGEFLLTPFIESLRAN